MATTTELKTVHALSELPEEHLQWIIDRSVFYEYKDGDVVSRYGEPADEMWFSYVGKIAYYMYLNGRQVYYYTFENNNTTGGVGGLLPYSRMKTFPGYAYALGEVKIGRLHKKHFAELELLNPEFIQRLIGYMTERAKAFATIQLQHEKVNALGNLAAGIAHELNNPAAAISEISEALNARVNRNYELTKNLIEANITSNQLLKITSLVHEKEHPQVTNAKKSLMQRMQSEDEIEEWLEENGIATRELAETFAEFGFTKDDLETMNTDLGNASFEKVMPWLENLISSHKIIKDLAHASERISKLVTSIKSHVHMDRTNDLQGTNLHRDIENTLTLLGFKLREKNIEVIKDFDETIPEFCAYVGELNQVWTNLIDNAIFAMPKSGTLQLETSHNSKCVVVKIIDNGQGIPPDILSRIFDPFFTTKKVGDGSGIGLDIVNRIVKKHQGDIKVNSKPGRTEFMVSLPKAIKPAET